MGWTRIQALQAQIQQLGGGRRSSSWSGVEAGGRAHAQGAEAGGRARAQRAEAGSRTRGQEAQVEIVVDPVVGQERPRAARRRRVAAARSGEGGRGSPTRRSSGALV